MEEVVSILPPTPLQPPSPASSTAINQPLYPLATAYSPTLPWSRTLFKLPHIRSSQKLAFYPPLRKGDRIVALCSKDEVERTAETWKDALQGFFEDKRPFLPSVITALKRKWEIKEAIEVFPRPDGSLIFLFNSLEERKKVLNSGPWFVMGRYLHIRPWSRSIRSRKDFFSSLRVWIHLPNLPLHLWSPGSIGKIASVIGSPLYLDENSANSTKISYARVCVEISADKPPPNSVQVEVEDSEETFVQPVEYETAFRICSDCKVFGHLAKNCAKFSTMKPAVKGPKKSSNVARSKILDNNKQLENLLTGQERDRSWTKVQYKNKTRNIQAAGVESLNMEESVDNPKRSGNLIGTPVVGEDQEGDVILTEDVIPHTKMGEGTLSAGEGDQTNEKVEDYRSTFSDLSAGNPFTIILNQQKTPILPSEDDTRARLYEADQVFTGPAANKSSFEIQSEAETEESISILLGVTGGAECNLELSNNFSPKPPDELPILPPTPSPAHVPIPNQSGQAQSTLDPTLLSNQINPNLTQSLICFRPNPTVTSNLSPNFTQTQQLPNVIPDLTSMEVSSVKPDEDMEFSILLGFAPNKEDMNNLKNFMKEGVALVPPEHYKEFIATVDLAKDSKILEFFQENFKENSKANEDTNFLSFQKVLRAQSPPRPDSANFGVEVKGSQIAKVSNENEVQNNEGAPLQKCNNGVRIDGDQVAGKDNKNIVGCNKYRTWTVSLCSRDRE